MSTTTGQLPKPFHDAVERWRERYLPDYSYLMENWERFFPREPRFELCYYREQGMCPTIECGERKGDPKYSTATAMPAEQTQHLLGAVRAQASTEFGSIQQHQTTLARAQSEEDQAMVLRMMAEELRHGYQMLHVLLEDDWSAVTQETSAQMVEEILSMTTGSHLLGAFNIDFDSFVDNITFCALLDRVGKYQLAMQKISAYSPMAESMPQMLREEAFHLATGVVPLRRWMEQAARGDVYITVQMIQKAFNKWLPRALEMFGDERGGGTNVRFGLKPMKNADAQAQYYEEVKKVAHDLNMRFVRARLPHLGHPEAEALLRRVVDGGETVEGIGHQDLLRVPHREFFRRRGVPAYRMLDVDGRPVEDAEAYLRHLAQVLPESYLANRDFREYAESLRAVAAGQVTAEQAAARMPALRRVGGTCPCSKALRWVRDEPAAPSTAA